MFGIKKWWMMVRDCDEWKWFLEEAQTLEMSCGVKDKETHNIFNIINSNNTEKVVISTSVTFGLLF